MQEAQRQPLPRRQPSLPSPRALGILMTRLTGRPASDNADLIACKAASLQLFHDIFRAAIVVINMCDRDSHRIALGLPPPMSGIVADALLVIERRPPIGRFLPCHEAATLQHQLAKTKHWD